MSYMLGFVTMEAVMGSTFSTGKMNDLTDKNLDDEGVIVETVSLRDEFSPNMQVIVASLMGMFAGIRDVENLSKKTNVKAVEGQGDDECLTS
jgi:hypothetical protein